MTAADSAGLCVSAAEPDDWFPVGAGSAYDSTLESAELLRQRREVRAAIAVCMDCPIRRNCLLEAISRKETEGIWGGLLPAERRAHVRRLRRRTGAAA